MKTCAVKASVSVSDGGKDDEEETGGAEELDPFAFVVLLSILKLAVAILHPIMASNAVGVLFGRVVVVVAGVAMLSIRSDTGTCLPLAAMLSLVALVVTGGLTFSRKLGAPSRKA